MRRDRRDQRLRVVRDGSARQLRPCTSAAACARAQATARLETHLAAGRDVVVLCEGDPSLYGSYLHLHERLAGRFESSIVPGVSSVAAAAAAAAVPLVQHDETLS